ncbi:hypothetical protein K493DRAFT_316106 [Basidiobolus meristosporus CBS 931.73]|uniref:Uncharacterized protein n=1 Tax=Basidiobolus meristosporus CBS 931.73 TaxID=1314790 RepID=A0A1Y1Y5G2_9FUNG|nr:hypothetical protein K493DRAFT_316106 [Basidiobolus meristosporus CBS 931.73]|eukprot:ORX93252.1 hypothetical protein K493DRAFT_316106 [Basidiobolus meristosporus CBS 931.73]
MFEELSEVFGRLRSYCRRLQGEYSQSKSVSHVGSLVLRDTSNIIEKAHHAYMYPIKGIAYFCKTPQLWSPIVSTLVAGIGVSLVVTVGMFVFTYIPQTIVLTFIMGPFFAAVVSFILVLIETFALVFLIVQVFFIDHIQDDIFEKVLVLNGNSLLVKEGAGRKQSLFGKVGSKSSVKLQKAARKLSPGTLLQYLVTIPLNFIPVIGSAVFFIINGTGLASKLHTSYFDLKGWDKQRRAQFIKKHEMEYYGFGGAALILDMVPIVNVCFLLTNIVGAALWAVDIEKNSSKENLEPDNNPKPIENPHSNSAIPSSSKDEL